MLSAALLAAAIVPVSAAHASAGNQQGAQYLHGGYWDYGVSSTVVWSRYHHSWFTHYVGVQAGERVVWAKTKPGWRIYLEIPRVAYENYQFAGLGDPPRV